MPQATTYAEAVPSESEFKKAFSDLVEETKKMKRLSKQEEALLMPSQAAAMIGISAQSMERKIKDKSIRAFKVLGKTWVSGKQIDELMNERFKQLLESGEDKNKIEESIYRKMYLNAKLIQKNRKKKQ